MTTWLTWINFILIILIIIFLLIITFVGGGLVRGVNYEIVDLPPGDPNVELKTGSNVMGIGAPTVEQTVTVLANSANRKGVTFRITNSSTEEENMLVIGGAGVSIDNGPIGNVIEPGVSAGYIFINDNNAILRFE